MKDDYLQVDSTFRLEKKEKEWIDRMWKVNETSTIYERNNEKKREIKIEIKSHRKSVFINVNHNKSSVAMQWYYHHQKKIQYNK